MAVYESNIAASQKDYSTNVRLGTQQYYGRVRIVSGSYTCAGTEAAGSVIRLARLPKGAKLLAVSRLYIDAGFSTSLTLKCGDGGDDDRYMAAAAPGSSAKTVELSLSGKDGGYVLTESDWIILTTGGAALTLNKKIGFELLFVVD